MKIGFIGCGNMAGAIINGLICKNVEGAHNITVTDVSTAALEKAKAAMGVNASAGIDGLADCEIVILAVKPNAVEAVAQAARGVLTGKSIISIVAGLTMQRMEKLFEGNALLRVMPNTPAMYGEGMAVLVEGATLPPSHRKFAEAMFGAIGKYVWVDERQFDAAGTIGGCTPAFVFMFIEALADGGVREGLARGAAMELAAQAVLGSAKMALESGRHPGALKDMVCSPGGMTIEGVLELERGGFRASVIQAVSAAAQKAKIL